MEAHYKIFNELYDHMVNISVWVMLEKKKNSILWFGKSFSCFLHSVPHSEYDHLNT